MTQTIMTSNPETQTVEAVIAFPFTTTVNESIKQIGQSTTLKPGDAVTVYNALPNRQFLTVGEHHRPLHIDRFNLTAAQRALIRTC